MTIEERNNKLKYLITCMKCEVSGKCCDENCPTQYDAGHTGEIIENLEEISKILEQEPCDDAISRKAMLDYQEYLYGLMPNDENFKLWEFIKDLPSVTPTHKWISCSDRLPKENEYVDGVCKYYLIQDEYGDMHVAHYTNTGWRLLDSLSVLYDNVVAWRSLPEIYKAESEGDE